MSRSKFGSTIPAQFQPNAVAKRAETLHLTYVQRPPHVATSEQAYDADEQEFIFACAAYIKRTGHRFPAFSELLGVLRTLGYAKPV